MARILRLAREHGTWGLAVALFAGMLFWTKIRIIEPIPRSAYADPPGGAERLGGYPKPGRAGRAGPGDDGDVTSSVKDGPVPGDDPTRD